MSSKEVLSPTDAIGTAIESATAEVRKVIMDLMVELPEEWLPKIKVYNRANEEGTEISIVRGILVRPFAADDVSGATLSWPLILSGGVLFKTSMTKAVDGKWYPIWSTSEVTDLSWLEFGAEISQTLSRLMERGKENGTNDELQVSWFEYDHLQHELELRQFLAQTAITT